MSIFIQYSSGTDSFTEGYTLRVTALVEMLLEEQELSGGEVGVVITDNATMQKLNRDYRAKDAPTDVLSFSYIDPDEQLPRIDPAFAVGDIFISYEQAMTQAEEAGHTLQREVAFLIIHGMLHLLGYDHEEDSDAVIMKAKEQEELKKFERDLSGGEENE